VSSLNQTTLMKLRYPNALDKPCDWDESWCTFTGDIDAVFTKWENGLNRSYPAVPFAMLQLTAQVNVGNSQPVPFDTVVVDTAGMTDLDADPYGIIIPKTARYTVAWYFKQLTGGIVNGQISGSGGTVPTIQHLILDRNIALGYGNTTDFDVFTFLQGDRIVLTTFESGATSRTILEAWLAVYWHADQEMP
jgi:hypothetical protein